MKLMTAKHAAAYLDCHVNTLKRRKEIPYYTLNHRGDRRYDQEELDRWLQARVHAAVTAPINSTPPSSAPARAATQGASSFVQRHPRPQVRPVR